MVRLILSDNLRKYAKGASAPFARLVRNNYNECFSKDTHRGKPALHAQGRGLLAAGRHRGAGRRLDPRAACRYGKDEQEQDPARYRKRLCRSHPRHADDASDSHTLSLRPGHHEDAVPLCLYAQPARRRNHRHRHKLRRVYLGAVPLGYPVHRQGAVGGRQNHRPQLGRR